jgi:hypothetical protein
MQDAKKADAERTLRLGLCVNLEEDDEDDAGPSMWHGDDGSQGCSTWASQGEPSSDNDDRDANYDVFYQRLGMN